MSDSEYYFVEEEEQRHGNTHRDEKYNIEIIASSSMYLHAYFYASLAIFEGQNVVLQKILETHYPEAYRGTSLAAFAYQKVPSLLDPTRTAL